MSPVSLLLNILWIVLGGAWMAFGWLVAAIIMAITIIGMPWARAAFNIAAYTLFPFGFKAVSRDALYRAGRYRHRTARRRSATSSGWCWQDGGWRSGM